MFRSNNDKLSIELSLTTWSAPLWRDVQEAVEEKLRAAFPELTSLTVRQSVQNRPAPKLGEVGVTAKSVIAVGSGKGGVGKSTIAATLAFGLKRAGCKVGLMDADVYGPSIPHLLGLSGRPTIENERIQPIFKDGIPVMSMGLLVPKDEAVIWRGPMLHGAVTQFLRDTNWGDLDYLIIDMPPGTGDIALSLSQLLPLTGAVVVCTPQDVALLDAVKAIAMFRKVRIPVLGVIENMSGFVCPGCGQRHDIFGSGGARRRRGLGRAVPGRRADPVEDSGVRRRGADRGELRRPGHRGLLGRDLLPAGEEPRRVGRGRAAAASTAGARLSQRPPD